MLIDLDDYVDRIMIGYITYHDKSFRDRYDDLGLASDYFYQEYRSNLDGLGEQFAMMQAEQIQREIQEGSNNIADELNLISNLQNGRLTESILNQIAEGFNESLYGEYDNKSADQLMHEALSFSGMLEGGASAASIDQFFNLLLQTLQRYGGFNNNLLVQLTGIGQRLTGPEFQISGDWDASTSVSGQDIVIVRTIVKELKNVAYQFKNNGGTLDSQRLSIAITNIFKQIVGRKLAGQLLGNSIADALTSMEDQLVSSVPGLTIQNKTSKINSSMQSQLLKSPVLNLRVTSSGSKAIIEIGNDTEISWFNGAKKDNRIQLISRSPLNKYLTNAGAQYFGYNLLVHSRTYPEAWGLARASIAASFFRDWVTNAGQLTSARSDLNKMQFLLVNGKLFPVVRIIRNICEEYLKNEKAPVGLTIQHADGFNTWEGDSNRPDIGLAIKRSTRVKAEVLNKLTISARFNPNILLKYAY